MTAKNHLQKLRKNKDWSQWKLATTASVDRALISGIESHSHLPTAPVRDRLARALGVPVSHVWPTINHSSPKIKAA